MNGFRLGATTDIGRRRTQNQDSFAATPELGLFLVADGMGGHRGGEIASALACEKVVESIRNSQKLRDWNPRAALINALGQANLEILEHARKNTALTGMGTTATSILFKQDSQTVTLGHVGDSRCYLLRDGCIWQLTRDHSLVQEKLRAGLITRDEVKRDTMRNVITRSVGYEKNLRVEIYEFTLAPGDTFLLCSDGLTGHLEDQEICDLFHRERDHPQHPQRTVDLLIAQANARGGDDNITTLLVEAQRS